MPLIHYIAAVLTVGFLAGTALGQTASPVQATDRPDGLSVVEPVQAVGSDAASAAFDGKYLSPMRQFLNNTLRPGAAFNDSLHYLDPSKLTLTTMADTRV